MSDIQNPNGFEVNETIDGANDLMHIYQPGSAGVRRNKKILLDTLKIFFQALAAGVAGRIVTLTAGGAFQDSGVNISVVAANTAASALNTIHRGSNGNDHSNLVNAYKGLNRVVLTNYTTTGVPAIAVNSVCEINGLLYTNPIAVVISGATANSTWYDILLTPSGTTFTAAFVARGIGVWSDSKQGLYSGNNRVAANVYIDGSGNYINKNVLIVVNRKVEIQIEIHDWDMVAAATKVIVFDNILPEDIASISSILIRNDANNKVEDLSSSDAAFTAVNGDMGSISISGSDAVINLSRRTGGDFDNALYDTTPFKRGEFTLKYKV